MIVLGADMHKRSHTIAAVGSSTGELLGERTVGVRGFGALLVWARALGSERVRALEDCRHVSARAAALDHGRPRVRPLRTQKSGPPGSPTRSSSHGCSSSHAHVSMPTSRRRPPLPRRTSNAPRR